MSIPKAGSRRTVTKEKPRALRVPAVAIRRGRRGRQSMRGARPRSRLGSVPSIRSWLKGPTPGANSSSAVCRGSRWARIRSCICSPGDPTGTATRSGEGSGKPLRGLARIARPDGDHAGGRRGDLGPDPRGDPDAVLERRRSHEGPIRPVRPAGERRLVLATSTCGDVFSAESDQYVVRCHASPHRAPDFFVRPEVGWFPSTCDMPASVVDVAVDERPLV